MGFSPANLLFVLWAMTTTISGTVVDEAGQPVMDVEVRLSPDRDYPATFWEPEVGTVRARTSAQGAFRLERIPTGRVFDLVVTRPGFAPSLRTVRVLEHRSVPPLRITLRRGRTVSGTVVDGTGRPAAGVEVELARSRAVAPPDQGLHRARTGPDGRFTIPDLPAGRFDLAALGPGFRLRLAEAVQVAPGAEPLGLGTFILERSVLEGRVRDAEGRPVAEAEVWVYPEGWDPDWWSTDFDAEKPAAVTGPDGRFEFPGLPDRGWSGLIICRKGFAPAIADSSELLREPVEVVLSPVVPLSGKVVDSRGEPVAGVRVWAETAGTRLRSSIPPKGPCPPDPSSSDIEGRFTLDLARPGWYDVEAWAEGFLDAGLERVGAPSDEDLVLALETGVTVEGKILGPEGEPIPRALVGSYDGRGGSLSLSRLDGSYRLSGLEPGQSSLKAEHPDYSEGKLVVEVPAEGRRIDIVLQPRPRREIRGRVLGPDGEPVEGALVSLQSGIQTMTEADGSFLLLSTKQDEPWLRAEKEGYGAGQTERLQPPVSGVEVRLARSASLTGRLLGLAPEELAEAAVSVRLGENLSKRRGVVDSEARYRVLDLVPGEWTVNAEAGVHSLFENVTLPPDVPEAVHDFVFPPTFEVRGQVTSPEGEPLAGAAISFKIDSLGVSVTRTAERDGTFLVRLKDGEYSVTASLPDYFGGEANRIVPVAGAPVYGVDFELRKGTVLTGRILGFNPREGQVSITASLQTDLQTDVWADLLANFLTGAVDQEGNYSISGMPPGTWDVEAVLDVSPSAFRRIGTGQITLLPGEAEAVLDLEVPADHDVVFQMTALSPEEP